MHDAPEDQGGYAMLAQIKARFGDKVAHIVEGCKEFGAGVELAMKGSHCP